MPWPCSRAAPEHPACSEDGGFLGELDPYAGIFVEYPVPSANSGYYNIALGPAALWFSKAGAFAVVPTKVGFLPDTLEIQRGVIYGRTLM